MWQVQSQVQTTAKDATGNYVSVVRVFFTVGAQGPFSVDIPVSTYTVQAAQAAISAYAASVSAVEGLTGTTAAG